MRNKTTCTHKVLVTSETFEPMDIHREPLSVSLCDIDTIIRAVAARAPKEGYKMSLVGRDQSVVIEAVNQGIDSHLEGCFLPDRGDSYQFVTPKGIEGRISGQRLECRVSPESLPVLVRRLLESDKDEAMQLASAIADTLDIECI
jgi:hypothetical protein